MRIDGLQLVQAEALGASRTHVARGRADESKVAEATYANCPFTDCLSPKVS